MWKRVSQFVVSPGIEPGTHGFSDWVFALLVFIYIDNQLVIFL